MTKNIINMYYIIVGDLMQRFKPKRRLKKLFLIKFIILVIIIIFICKYIFHLTVINSSVISKFVTDNNFKSNSNIFSKIYDVGHNIINNPKELLLFKVDDTKELVVANNDTSKIKEEIKDEVKEEKKDDKIQIYIYSSHQKEDYKIDYMEDYNITPGVYLASLLLQEKLNSNGIKTEVMTDDITKYLNDNNLDYSRSYDASRYYLKSVVENNPDIKLFIDLHRDAAPISTTVTTINNLEYAKVMFVIGKEYATYLENLKIAEQINNKINEKYPTLSRGILQKEGYGVNGVYNQDLKSNVILIELGGNENNIEQVSNTVNILTEILGDYVNEKEEAE